MRLKNKSTGIYKKYKFNKGYWKNARAGEQPISRIIIAW